MIATAYAIARVTAIGKLLRRSYVAFRRGDFPRRRAAVLAVKYYGFYN